MWELINAGIKVAFNVSSDIEGSGPVPLSFTVIDSTKTGNIYGIYPTGDRLRHTD